MAKWLKTVGGEVCAPGNITCRSIHGGRTIDFFIVDSRISHGVEGIWTQMDFPSSPHYMVVLRLDVTAVRVQVVKIAVPRAFEPRPAIGCTRAPAIEPDMLPEISRLQEATVNEVFKNVMQNSERHLCRAFDCVLPCGAPDPRYQGRGEFLERKMRPAVPTQAGSEGTANPYMMGLSLMHLRCTELAALMHKHCQTGELVKFLLQWSNITEAIRRPKGALLTAVRGTIWEMRALIVGAIPFD